MADTSTVDLTEIIDTVISTIKIWYKSKTIWAALAIIGVGIMALFGMLSTSSTAIGAILGGLATVYGRSKADTILA